MPSYKDVYPDSRYANAKLVISKEIADKQTIGQVYMEEVGKDKDQKLVAYFLTSDEILGSDRVLVLNKTNCTILEESTGSDDYSTWKDLPIELMIINTNMPDGTPTKGIQLKVLKK